VYWINVVCCKHQGSNNKRKAIELVNTHHKVRLVLKLGISILVMGALLWAAIKGQGNVTECDDDLLVTAAMDASGTGSAVFSM
jgi:ATP-dependent protease HslVU (ClpYQ) peptidase subunit